MKLTNLKIIRLPLTDVVKSGDYFTNTSVLPLTVSRVNRNLINLTGQQVLDTYRCHVFRIVYAHKKRRRKKYRKPTRRTGERMIDLHL